MIISFECKVNDKLKTALDNYLNPKSLLLSATDGLYVEKKVYYYGDMVLIVERGLFDVIAEYMVYTGSIGLVFSVLVGGLEMWGGVFSISLFMILVSLIFMSSKIRFYLLRWRIHKKVDADLRMDWLSKEQVVSRFIHGVKKHGSK